MTVDVKYKHKTVVEKETDINIAIQLLDDYYNKEFDKAIILSGDTDFIPAIDMIKSKQNHPKIGVLRYYERGAKVSYELEKACDFALYMEINDLKKSLFSQSIVLENGKIITAPFGWI